MRLENFDTERRYAATVKSSMRITSEKSDEEVRELILQIDDKDFTVDIGQSIGVIIPGPHPYGHKNHFRLYTIADLPWRETGGKPEIAICVKRCLYIDEYSGEEYKGIASNFLCDLRDNDTLMMSGPYGIPFELPEDKSSDLLLIGMGTGIAPFRAFVKNIYKNVGDWRGKVRLFYGAHTGLELLYMNDKRDDFENYYDEETFMAFKALSARPHWSKSGSLEQTLIEREADVWEMINNPKTHVYIAGLESIKETLDKAFTKMAGSADHWENKKAELIADLRWTELIY